MIGRWALKFWPDTRPTWTTTSASTAPTTAPWTPTRCASRLRTRHLAAADWVSFALNSGGETYSGISYTQIYTSTDEVVFPNLPPAPSTPLHTGEGEIGNVAVQRICPAHAAEHLIMGTTDPIGYALVVDRSRTTAGGPARISRSVCTQRLMPGVNPLTLPLNEARMSAEIATTLATYPHTSRAATGRLRGRPFLTP